MTVASEFNGVNCKL